MRGGMNRCLHVAVVLAALAMPSAALAGPRAEYATVADLEEEDPGQLLDVAVLGQYAHVAEAERTGGVSDLAGLALRSRVLVGRPLAWCAGVDGEIGGSNDGLAYGLTGYLLGAGARLGGAGWISLCGGAGFDGVAGGVPLAARFPAELSIGIPAGPVRMVPWARAVWTAGDSARRDGVSWTSAVDEVEAGLLVRFGREHRYWTTTSAGGGLALGVVYRELMDTSSIGFVIGLDLGGAQ
jgi:hypothetical protein